MVISLLIVVGGMLGALATFYLQKWGLHAVLASCLVGLVGYLIAYLVQQEDLALVIFAGTFVGMTAVSIATLPIILLAGTICGLLFILTEPFFMGYGGKLGAIAFVSVGVVFLLQLIYKIAQ